MHYAQVYANKNYVMACVELHNSNENIMEPVDWWFSYRFCSRFKSSWKWCSVVGWVSTQYFERSQCLQLHDHVVQEESKHGITRCAILLINHTYNFDASDDQGNMTFQNAGYHSHSDTASHPTSLESSI